METIVGVALKFENQIISMPAPGRHADLYLHPSVTHNSKIDVLLAEVGFITNTLRFVDRAEAMRVAFNGEQLNCDELIGKFLRSEQLW